MDMKSDGLLRRDSLRRVEFERPSRRASAWERLNLRTRVETVDVEWRLLLGYLFMIGVKEMTKGGADLDCDTWSTEGRRVGLMEMDGDGFVGS